ncbi:ImmA/IrrE family metallo-endopeptidase [Agromyces sp. NPDC058104]|uniref:ImmA/IrrE family metallo-endopeptidase n=1 Tax=Agromyces sp. NPDC058104 TaxID=3346342 RepID=UPI0036DD15DF
MHFERLDSLIDIRKHARGALIAADATDDSFVPLERVAEAVKLRQADLFDLGADPPPALLRAMAKLRTRSKLLGMLSVKQKTIYVDPDQTDRQKRFTTAHEIGHFVLPWQEESFHLDDRGTLSPTTKATFEREANAFAGELMFGAGRFNTQADSDAPGIATPLALAAEYGASAAATIRQYVEHSGRPLALLTTGLFEQRHRGGVHIPVFAGQCATSEAFDRRHGPLQGMLPSDRITPEMPLFHLLSQMPAQGVGDLTELTLLSSRGATKFKLESFSNGRARYLLLFRRTRLSGQQRQLVDVTGRPLR